MNIGSGLISINQSWTELKGTLAKKGLQLQCYEETAAYNLFCIDGIIVYLARLYKDGYAPVGDDYSADITDYLTHHASSANALTAAMPRTSAGTPLMQANIIKPGYLFYGTTTFDNPTTNQRGSGALIGGSFGTGTHVVEGRFIEHVYIHGGYIQAKNGGVNDYVSLLLKSPASSPASTPGAGNATKVPTGLGFNIIVPVPGDWTVDGATLEAGEINQDLSPVPNATGTGHWNWDPTQNPSIAPANGDGGYDLFDAPLPLARQANRYPLLSSISVTPSAAVKGKKILPHWVWEFTFHRDAVGDVDAIIRLETSRIKTV